MEKQKSPEEMLEILKTRFLQTREEYAKTDNRDPRKKEIQRTLEQITHEMDNLGYKI